MSNSSDKRWEEKNDGISTLLREQNEELIKKYLSSELKLIPTVKASLFSSNIN